MVIFFVMSPLIWRDINNHDSHIESLNFDPSVGVDEDDNVLPHLIGHFEDNGDSDSNDPITIVSSDDFFDSPGIQHALDVVIPPLYTPFTGGYASAVHYIEFENTRCLVPFQYGWLVSTTQYDGLLDDNNRPTKDHWWWVVSQGKLAAAKNQRRKKDLSLTNGGASAGISGFDMRPMDDSHLLIILPQLLGLPIMKLTMR